MYGTQLQNYNFDIFERKQFITSVKWLIVLRLN